jgi:hypothetical protein
MATSWRGPEIASAFLFAVTGSLYLFGHVQENRNLSLQYMVQLERMNRRHLVETARMRSEAVRSNTQQSIDYVTEIETKDRAWYYRETNAQGYWTQRPFYKQLNTPPPFPDFADSSRTIDD